MLNKEKAEKVLREMYKNNNNRTHVANAVGISRPNLYKVLDTLRREGLIDSNRNVTEKIEVISLAQMVAEMHLGEKRVDSIGNTLVIYNPKRSEVRLSKEELRFMYGVELQCEEEQTMEMGNEYIAIDFNNKAWTIEEVVNIIVENEEFYMWYREHCDMKIEVR